MEQPNSSYRHCMRLYTINLLSDVLRTAPAIIINVTVQLLLLHNSMYLTPVDNATA